MDRPYTAILHNERGDAITTHFDEYIVTGLVAEDIQRLGKVNRIVGFVGDDRDDPLFVAERDETMRYDWIAWVKTQDGLGIKGGFNGNIYITCLNLLSIYHVMSYLGSKGVVLEPPPAH